MRKNEGKMMKGWFRWSNIVGLVACFGLMCFVAVRRDGTLFGKSVTKEEKPKTEAFTGATAKAEAKTHIIVTDTVVSSEGKNVGVRGYKGEVPVEVTISSKKIVKVVPLENMETPGFFQRVMRSGILDAWNGKTPEEARKMNVDAVTGATYSSKALIANVNAAIADIDTAPKQTVTPKAEAQKKFSPDWQWFVALAVAMAGCLLPLVLKGRKYRIVQLTANVAVFGFLTGSFLSFSLVVNFLSRGFGDWLLSLVALIMLFAAFVMPLFGHSRHYCLWICPLGSAQELLGMAVKHKPHISASTAKILKRVRDVLWWTLMVAMWMGAWYEWMDYEPFGWFRVWEASAAVIVIGAIIMVLSLIVERPFCRFVCPTGKLMRQSERTE